MYKLLLVLLLVENRDSWTFDDDNDGLDFSIFETRKNSGKTDYNKTFFMSLENYQVGGVLTTEAEYPWVARVVHSRTNNFPHMCTAACIDKRIFVTAARLKVTYTTVIYQSARLPPLAFVIPSNSSKQAFDDIGFIVVWDVYTGLWATIKHFHQANRTDPGFQWFEDLNLSNGQRNKPIEHKVVGYAVHKKYYRIKKPEKKFDLFELKIVVDINLCWTIMTLNHSIQGFHVPCYHSCTLEQFKYNDDSCKNYHGVEGGAVFDTSTKQLLGIVTWGVIVPNKYELPVGFAIPNSENFYNDYACAKRIRNDNGLLAEIGYQSLCD